MTAPALPEAVATLVGVEIIEAARRRRRPATPAELARRLAVEVGASEISIESFAARETYSRVAKEALSRYKIERPIRVTAWPPKGSGRGGGDAVARAAALLQGLETGTVRLAGFHPDFEAAAVTWQAGQHCPDALAALVVAHDMLIHAAGQEMTIAAPVGRLGDRATVTSLTDFLRRRVDGSGDYDPLRHLRTARR